MNGPLCLTSEIEIYLKAFIKIKIVFAKKKSRVSPTYIKKKKSSTSI